MKAILILRICIVFLCVVCCASDPYLDYRLKMYARYVEELQKDIQQKIDSLYSHGILTLLSTQFSWAAAQQALFSTLDMKRSEALNETLAYVESAAGKTKNLQHCYDKGHKAFEVLKYRALLVYYECEDVGFMQFTAPNPDLEKIAEQGKKAIENLRKAIPPCILIHSLRTQEICIVTTIRDTKPSVLAFEEIYKTVHHIRANKYLQISNTFNDCYKRQINIINEEIPKIRTAASNCTQGL